MITSPSRTADVARSSPDRERTPHEGLLPLVIGVTGHRDLRAEDWPALEDRVSAILSALSERYPHTPLILLSSLAEGADTLVARTALDHGMRLIVPLPMRQDLYEADFQDAAALDRFRELVARADQVLTLPLLASEDAVRAGGEARARQYEQVGAYIALHNQILIALWDGRFTGLMGGTSEIIRFRRHGVPHPYASRRSALDIAESGPVYWVVTPRVRNPNPTAEPFGVQVLYPRDAPQPISDDDEDDDRTENGSADPDAATGRFYDRLFRHLDTFNRDALRLDSSLAGERQESRGYLLPAEWNANLPAELEAVVATHVVADTLAVYFRRRTHRVLVSLLSLAFLSVLSVDLYAHVSVHLTPLLYLYPAALVLGVVLWYFSVKRPDVQNKYLDYRALAEGLRIQCYWRIAGVTDSVAEHYLRRQKSEPDWIRNGIRATDLTLGRTQEQEVAPDPRLPAFDLVLRYWVESQSTYFKRAAVREHRKRELVGFRIWGLFLLGIATAISLCALVAALTLAGLATSRYEAAENVLLVVSTLSLVGAALSEGYADKMAFSDHSRQYRRMGAVFDRAERHIRDVLAKGETQSAHDAILELGKEALAENGDWVALHRGRPVEAVKGA